MADAVVIEHRDDLLVNAVSDLVYREASGADGIASELERTLERLRRGTEVQDVANRLDLSLKALGLSLVTGLESLPEVDDDLGDEVAGTSDRTRGRRKPRCSS